MAIRFAVETKGPVIAFNVRRGERKVSFELSEIRTVEVDTTQTYEGAYSIASKISTEQTLPTQGKKMVEDMTILKVPQVEVANASGGNTLIIGDEYYA